MADPDWLTWTRELQAIAQTGLAFVRDPYDRERYEMLRSNVSPDDSTNCRTTSTLRIMRQRLSSRFLAQTGILARNLGQDGPVPGAEPLLDRRGHGVAHDGRGRQRGTLCPRGIQRQVHVLQA
jgi:hypothetical protein